MLIFLNWIPQRPPRARANPFHVSTFASEELSGQVIDNQTASAGLLKVCASEDLRRMCPSWYIPPKKPTAVVGKHLKLYLKQEEYDRILASSNFMLLMQEHPEKNTESI